MNRAVETKFGIMLALSVGSASALAQSADLSIAAAFDNHRQNRTNMHGGVSLALQLTQKDSIGTSVTQHDATLAWYSGQVGTRLVNKVEIVVYKNGQTTHRIVADGETVWSYEFGPNRYKSEVYDRRTGNQPQSYRADFFGLVGKNLPSVANPLWRLAVEMAYYADTRYQPWIPGIAPFYRSQDQNDPYRQTHPNDAIFLMPNTGKRIEFGLSFNQQTNVWSWESLLISEPSLIKNTQRSVVTSLRPWMTQNGEVQVGLNDPAFKFIPPAGARAIPQSQTITIG